MSIGIILSGSPYSVYDDDAPRADPAIFDESMNPVPVLGICYGLQEMSNFHGAKVESADHREYGKAMVSIVRDHAEDAKALDAAVGDHVDLLFEGVNEDVQVRLLKPTITSERSADHEATGLDVTL